MRGPMFVVGTRPEAIKLAPVIAVARFRGRPNVHCREPLPYAQMLWLLARCHFAITDSGGIQEEAPELGKPVLVTRVATERRHLGLPARRVRPVQFIQSAGPSMFLNST